MNFSDDTREPSFPDPSASGLSREDSVENPATTDQPVSSAGFPAEPPGAESSSHLEMPAPAAAPPTSFLPDDLRISWSWTHLALFALFALGSIIVIQIG